MRKISLALFCMIFFASSSVFAQINEEDLPPSNKPGTCYAKCVIADQYETVTERMLSKEASSRIKTIPATYETVTEQVLKKEGYTKKSVIPATYETVTERVLSKEASTRLEVIPAVYETVTERIMTEASRTEWRKGDADPTCLSANPDDCRVLCLVEIPAKYKTVTRRVLKNAASTREVTIPAEYATRTYRKIKTPEQVSETQVPAVYETVTRRVLKTPAKQIEEVIPEEYQTVTKRQLVKAGGISEWKEVICADKLTSQKIRQIQLALKAKGYDPGPIDNILGRETRDALRRYQTANNLPVGQVDLETMRSLGVSY